VDFIAFASGTDSKKLYYFDPMCRLRQEDAGRESADKGERAQWGLISWFWSNSLGRTAGDGGRRRKTRRGGRIFRSARDRAENPAESSSDR
jgi:hypothetical protein